MKGIGGSGLLTLLALKTWSFVATVIVIFMVMIAVIGPKPAATFAGTTAVVGGQSTGIVFASLPEFFRSVRDGQGMVKKPDCSSVVECAADKKAEASKTPAKKGS